MAQLALPAAGATFKWGPDAVAAELGGAVWRFTACRRRQGDGSDRIGAAPGRVARPRFRIGGPAG